MNMKEFAQYLKHISFDEALHKIRRMSLERIVVNEPGRHEQPSIRTFVPTTTVRKTA